MDAAAVEVVEPRLPARVRRPSDLVRLVGAIVVLVTAVALGDVAIGAAGALESDLHLATGGLPHLLLTILGWAGGVGVIALPLAVGAELMARGKVVQLVQAVGAAAVSAGAVVGLNAVILDGHMGGVLRVLTRPVAEGRTPPVSAVEVSLVAFLTVCRVAGRRWHQAVAVLVLGSTVLTGFLSGASTALSLGLSLVFGWAIGLAFRYGFGAQVTLPDGRQIAGVIVAAGIPLRRLTLETTGQRGDRRYRAETDDGDLDAVVIDRDTFGLATLRSLGRRLRLQSASTRRPSLTVRSEVEYRSLMALTFQRLGLSAPRLVATAPVGAFCSVMVLRPAKGSTLAHSAQATSDDVLAQLWLMVSRMQRAKVTHRELETHILLVGDRPGVTSLGSGDIAADDLTLRLDLAQALVSVSLAVGVARAVDSAVAILGAESVRRVLPLVQKVALGHRTRVSLKDADSVLDDLRHRVAVLQPDQPVPKPVELRRVTVRTLLTVVGGGIAAYVVLTQLAKVNLLALVSHANWWWVAGCIAFSAATFVGPTLSISGAAEARLSFVRTYMTQLAVAFSGLVAPAAVGNIALNTRYLVGSGLAPASAAATVGLVQAAQLCSYLVLLLASGAVAGTGTQASFAPSPGLVAGILVVVLILLALSAVPKFRQFAKDRIVPQVLTIGPQILRVLRNPARLARMVGGSLLLDVSFVAALVCATRALGAHPPIAAVAVVYFAGAIIGSAVPTPGGLGGIEAAVSAGLVAIGVDAGVAVSSVLLYRVATYWLPIPFGWFALNRLQAAKAI